LKEEIRGLFNREMNQVAKLEFIDAVQRLGLGYHFETETKNALSSIYDNAGYAQLLNDTWIQNIARYSPYGYPFVNHVDASKVTLPFLFLDI